MNLRATILAPSLSLALTLLACSLTSLAALGADAPAGAGVTDGPMAALRPGDGDRVQEAVAAAFRAGSKKIVIPPGTYPVDTLKWPGLSNFEIEATGVVFVTPDARGFLRLRDCHNVLLRGATFRSAVPSITQGTVVAVSPVAPQVDVRLDTGYPEFDPAAKPTGGVFNAQSRMLKVGTGDVYGQKVQSLGDGVYRVTYSGSPMAGLAPGDLMAFRNGGEMGVRLDDCSGITLDHVTVNFAGSFGFLEAGGAGGNSYLHCVIEPGPKPKGATTEPLWSQNADGLHSSGVHVGPLVEGCRFERMPDDGIAIHGSYQMVRQADGNQLVVMAPWAANAYHPGDTLGLVLGNGVSGGEARIVKTELLAPGFLAPLATQAKHFQDNKFFFRVTLDAPLPAHEGDFVCDQDYVGSGYVIRGNTILNNRARGILLKASSGLVENNIIDGSSIAGIVLSPEFWWGEADYSSDVIIRGNTISHTGYASAGPGSRLGALTVAAQGDSPVALGHHRITIENNLFLENDNINLFLDGLQDSSVLNNRFVSAQKQVGYIGSKAPEAGALIVVDRALRLRFAGNTVSKLGAANTGLVLSSANSVELSGLPEGVAKR